MRWLKWEKRCMVVLSERSPREPLCGRPDALGVTAGRYLIEVEIKRSLSDFNADKHKRSRRNRDMYLHQWPRQFYYLVPGELLDAASKTLPTWAGLMMVSSGEGWHSYRPQVMRPSPVNKESKRLSLKECVSLVRQMGSHTLSALERAESTISGYRFGHEPYFKPDFEI